MSQIIHKDDIRLLTVNEAPVFKEMTYGYYKPFLNCARMMGKCLLLPVGLYHGGLPAGLALGLRQPNEPFHLLSVFVKKSIRRRGWASRLIEFMATACRERGVDEIESFYFDHRPNTSVVEALLSANGFASAEPIAFHCKCDKRLGEMRMLDYTGLPDGYDTIPWLSLTPERRNELWSEWSSESWFDPMLSPFEGECHIEPNTSLALLRDDEVCGWALCHVSEPDMIVHSALFVKPEIQGLGIGVPLQMRSISAQVKTGLIERYPFGMFIVRYDNVSRLRVAKKRFAQYAVQMFDQVVRRKAL